MEEKAGWVGVQNKQKVTKTNRNINIDASIYGTYNYQTNTVCKLSFNKTPDYKPSVCTTCRRSAGNRLIGPGYNVDLCSYGIIYW